MRVWFVWREVDVFDGVDVVCGLDSFSSVGRVRGVGVDCCILNCDDVERRGDRLVGVVGVAASREDGAGDVEVAAVRWVCDPGAAIGCIEVLRA